MTYNVSTNPGTGAPQVQRRYSNGRRIGYTVLWSIYTLVLAIAGLASLAQAQVLAGLVISALAVLTGRYAMRIWTYRARSLWLLLFF